MDKTRSKLELAKDSARLKSYREFARKMHKSLKAAGEIAAPFGNGNPMSVEDSEEKKGRFRRLSVDEAAPNEAQKKVEDAIRLYRQQRDASAGRSMEKKA